MVSKENPAGAPPGRLEKEQSRQKHPMKKSFLSAAKPTGRRMVRVVVVVVGGLF